MKRSQRFSLIILFLTLMVVNTGFGIIMPILPYYAQSMGASATILGLLSATYATLQFIFAPVWGRISDRIGRRPVLLLGLVGFSISFFIFGLADRIWILFLARIIGGILSSATMPTALAFIADTTRPENRARGMGLLGAAGGIGMILGPAAGGFLAIISIQVPFFAAAALALLVAAFAFFFLPETLTSHPALSGEVQSHSSRSRLSLIVSALSGPLAFLMVLATLTSFGMSQIEATGALYAKARFNLSSAGMGAAFILMGGLGVFTQFMLVARLIRRLGERGAIQLSLLGLGISFLITGYAPSLPPAILGVILLGISSALTRPALNTLVSRSAPPSEQGVTLGLVNSFYSLGTMFGPLTGGVIYDHLGINWPFYSAAIIHIGALLVSFRVFRPNTSSETC